MSGALALAVAAATPSVVATTPDLEPPAPLVQSISLAIPSTDGGRGAQITYERWLLPEARISVAVCAELREAAIGDYIGMRLGSCAEARWFWRARRGKAWLSRLPVGSMVGWFVGGGVALAADFTHDNADRRWLGTTLSVGTTARIGYRIAPWRGLVITPSAGFSVERDIDLSGRLPGWPVAGLVVGLEVGWMF